MKKFFIIILFFISVLPVAAQKNDALISGHVVSQGEHLAGATITIIGTTIGTMTDKTGHFMIMGLTEGKYKVRASYVGYKSREIEVFAPAGKTSELNFDLEQDNVQMETVVVSANRDEVSRKNAPVVVNVIGAKTLEAVNSMNLADGFSYQPGLRLETNCQNCGFQQVRINGLEGPYSQILIDSRPIFSSLNSVYGIEQIPANMIDRIEIVRGGGSALYGANAIGGTINVLTKIPLSNSFQLSSSLSFTDYKIPDRTTAVNISLINDDLNSGIVFFGALRDKLPFDANGDGFSESGKINNYSMGFKSFYKPSGHDKINLEFHTLNEFRRGGNKFNLQPHESDIAEQVEHTINSGSIDYSHITGESLLNIYFSLQHIDRKSYYGTGGDLNAYGVTTDLTSASGIQYSRSIERLFFAPAQITGGFEFQYNSLNDNMPGYRREINQDVRIAGAYFQSEWKWEHMKYLLGARLDRHNLVNGLIFSPRTTLLFEITEEFQTRLTYAAGYRAPQAFDEDLHVASVGGEALLIKLADGLKPEYSNTFSASLDLYPTFGTVQSNILLEAFYTKLDDVFVLEEIGLNNNGDKIIERKNGPGAEVYGLNMEIKVVPVNEINLQMGFTVQRSLYQSPRKWSDDPTVGFIKRMQRTPDNYGYFTLNYNLSSELTLNLSGIYTGSMLVPHYAGYISKDVMAESPTFFELNLKASYTFKLSGLLSLQLNAGMQNIFNSYQTDFDSGIMRDSGYIYGPSRPRTLFVGFKVFNL